MKRSTNRKILNYSLLPIIVLVLVLVVTPESVKGTEGSIYYDIVSFLWTLGFPGPFIFWTWGVGPHVVSMIMDPLERELKAGRIRPNSSDAKRLKVFRKFKYLNIYINTD
ncbi:MAG: hypothetical protein AB8B94_07725 [Hyphomicrobiales bacterium]